MGRRGFAADLVPGIYWGFCWVTDDLHGPRVGLCVNPVIERQSYREGGAVSSGMYYLFVFWAPIATNELQVSSRAKSTPGSGTVTYKIILR